MVHNLFWRNTILSYFGPQNGPLSRRFGMFEHSKWSKNKFVKNLFFRPGDRGAPTVGPHRVGAVLPSGSTK